MNSIILTCLGILCFVHFGQSAVYYAEDTSDPAYPGKCVIDFDSKKIIMDPGETITERKSCTRIHCSNPGYQMDFASCGTINFPPECHSSGIDETKDYPDCCPQAVCPEGDTTINSV